MLSSTDIFDWFTKMKLPTPEIIRYPDLQFLPTVVEDTSNCKFILYESEPRRGHWTIVFYNQVDDCVEFFDSYGIFVDDELEFSYHKDPVLSGELLTSGNKVFEINDLKFQDDVSSTCGIHCCLRYLFNVLGYSKKEYDEIFFYNIDDNARDTVVEALFNVLGKVEL